MEKPLRTRIPVKLAIGVLLALAIVVSYSHTLSNGFVWDDIPYLLQNQHVHAGLTLPGVKWAFTSMDRCNWHPLTWISTMLDCGLYGSQPWGHHLTNVLFHLANTILLFWLLIRLTGSVWRSGFVAALFAVHPLHVESVAWVAERKDVLSAFFLFLTMPAYLYYVKRPNWRRYCLVALLFAMGLMAKPMLVTLPIILLLLDYWPLGRFTKKHPVRILIWEKIPLLVLSLASSVIAYIAQQRSNAIAPYSLGLRVENALLSYVRYIGKMIWPSRLAVHYPFPEHGIPGRQVIGACLILAAITLIAFRTRKRRPYLLWGWLWYVITLIPVIGVVQVGAQSMADRYTYIPLIGLFVAITWMIPRTKAVFAIAPAVIVVLMFCTMFQVDYWKNDETLFRRVVSVTEGDAVACNYLGVTLATQGNLKEAEVYISKALTIDPRNVAAHVNMGDLLLEIGNKPAAKAHFEEALKLDPDNKEALLRMGQID